jgi:magnesium transporter
MSEPVTSLGEKAALPPGSLIPVCEVRVERPIVTGLHYDAREVDLIEDPSDDDLVLCRDSSRVAWLKVVGVHDVELIGRLGKIFKLHPLVLEDAINCQQRPKVEDYDDYLFIVLKLPRFENGALRLDQISLVVGPGYVIAFCEDQEQALGMVEDRIRRGRGRIRRMGPDYLAYAVIDAVVDHYFKVIEGLGENVEDLEDSLLARSHREDAERIHHYRRQAQALRRAIWAVREMVDGMLDSESDLIDEQTTHYLRDVYDHAVQIVEATETIRDNLAGLMDIYQNNLANKMNEVMKVLTIIATLFIPLTFLAGLYGMNFRHMPELGFWWAYPAVIGLMVCIAVVMLLFFRRRKWL